MEHHLYLIKILYFSNTAKILIITGTHGSESGLSGLSVKKCLEEEFYFEDCKSVGVKADGPDITRPAVKLGPSEMTDDCYYKDEQLKEMDFRLADMSVYHGRGDKLLEDIDQECL